MRCASALSTARDTETALRETLDRVAADLQGQTADLTLVFSSRHHADALATIAAEVRDRGLGRHVLGCTGESIVGEDQEVELGSALSLWSIQMPGVSVRPMRLSFDGQVVEGWPDDLDAAPSSAHRTLLVLADPFSFPMNDWLAAVDERVAGLPIVGGMASAGQEPGSNRLVLDGAVYSDGAVAVMIAGAVRVRAIVSQGCRPIGRPMLVTQADRNVIRELGRRPALERFREVFEELSADDQQRVREGLHVGRVINEYQESFGRGDFLVRNVMGADDTGAIAITDLIRVGQTVQFHVRDAETADEDLRMLLDQAKSDITPAGALLFTCNGRGSRLFPEPNHDVSVLREVLGPLPVAGFFAMGEIGPVGGRNFIHGYTASVALFEPAEGPETTSS